VSAVLALDTATPSTVVGLLAGGRRLVEARHDPAPGERPGHAPQLLGLVQRVLEEWGGGWADVERIGVGTGPGSFTGLRIGVATARGLAQASGAELVGVGTLRALAAGADESRRPVLAVVDARRGEAFVAAWSGERELQAARALPPDQLEEAVRAAEASVSPPARDAPVLPLAVGDGAIRFRAQLQAAGAAVPDDQSPLHRVAAGPLVRLAAAAEAAEVHAVLPDYVRPPDAVPARGRPRPDA
jgi:tRNA threonylcarbamoyladenosine biosynthesis protein TsaB